MNGDIFFKRFNKGLITNGFNTCGDYEERVGNCHTGVDYVLGYGAPVYFDNPGYIYKVYHPQTREDNWTGVYQLVPTKWGYMEVVMGHFLGIAPGIKEGVWVEEGQLAGWEGNFGEVYQGGLRITSAMQDKGDRRGHHVHEQYRPVIGVQFVSPNKHYLRAPEGNIAMMDGKYLEVMHDNNQKGCVDPMKYRVNNKEALALYKLAKRSNKDKNIIHSVADIVNAWGQIWYNTLV